MSNLVIVALPAASDDVWSVSSEKIPHMTVCFLGEAETNPNVSKIIDYVKEQAKYLPPFSLRVDHRGVLGSDEADVLFFADDIPWPVHDFRDRLLSDVNIKSAYNSVPQHTTWTPHLTLGYPDTPANKDSWDPKQTQYVSFDRISVWFSDYGGIDIPLTDNTPKLSTIDSQDVAWSEKLKDFLAHHGVKGQKWGVRKEKTPSSVSVQQKGKKLKTKGGENQPAHEDAVKARVIGQQAKKSGHITLSNAELEAYARRLDLEQRVKRLETNEQSGTSKWLKGLLKREGNRASTEVADKATDKAVRKFVNKAKLAPSG